MEQKSLDNYEESPRGWDALPPSWRGDKEKFQQYYEEENDRLVARGEELE